MEIYETSIKGIYRDRLRDSGGKVVFDSGWSSNTIVDGCRRLLAAFMKNDPSSGIEYLAVGQGNPEWDGWDDNEFSPCSATADSLTNPFIGPVISDLAIVYLSADNKPITDTSTTRLQITAVLGENYPTQESYPLREFGLFGVVDGPVLINCIRHRVIHKIGDSTLERRIRISF